MPGLPLSWRPWCVSHSNSHPQGHSMECYLSQFSKYCHCGLTLTFSPTVFWDSGPSSITTAPLIFKSYLINKKRIHSQCQVSRKLTCFFQSERIHFSYHAWRWHCSNGLILGIRVNISIPAFGFLAVLLSTLADHHYNHSTSGTWLENANGLLKMRYCCLHYRETCFFVLRFQRQFSIFFLHFRLSLHNFHF